MRKSLKYAVYFTVPGVFFLVFLLIFISSSFFLTHVVLPLVSRRTGLEIAASEVKWSPMRSELRARDLRIGNVENRCFYSAHAAFRYDLAELLQKRIALSDVDLKGANFALYRRGDGSWSCFPQARARVRHGRSGRDAPEGERLPQADAAGNPSAGGAAARKTKKPLQFRMRNIRVEDGTFRIFYSGGGEVPGVLELRNLTGTLDSFRNGAPFRLNLKGTLGMEGPELHVTSGLVSLALDGRWRPTLAPSQLAGNVTIDAVHGVVNQQPFGGDSIALELDVASPESNRFSVRKLHLSQLRGQTVRSDLELNGEVGVRPFLLRTNYHVRLLSEEVLALLCDFGFKLNPGRALLRCRGSADYADGILAASGSVHLQRSGDAFRNGERITLPALTFHGLYDVNVDLKKERARIRDFAFSLTDGEHEPLAVRLREPMDYSWKDDPAELPESAAPEQETHPDGAAPELEVVFREFDLKVLKFLLPPVAGFELDSGTFSGNVHLQMKRNFSELEMSGDTEFRDLAASRDGRRIALAELSLTLDALLKRNFDFAIRRIAVSLLEADGDELGGARFSAQGNLRRKTGSFEGRFERLTPRLAIWLVPGMAPLEEIWSQLGLRELSFDFGGEVAPELSEITIGKLVAALRRNDGDFMDFRMEPVRWSSTEGRLLGALRFRVNGSGNASEFNNMLRSCAVRFDAGRYRFELSGGIAANGVNMMLQGEAAFEQIAMAVRGRRFEDFAFQNTFSLYRPAPGMLDVKELNFYLRTAGKPALRLECPGMLNLETGEYRGEWSIRYLNEQFLRLLMPPPVPQAQISGKMQLVGQNFFHRLRVAGGIDLNRLTPAGSEEPADGKLQFVAEYTPESFEVKKLDTRLARAGETLIDVSGSCRMVREDAAGPVRLQLFGESLKLDRLAALWGELNRGREPEPPVLMVRADSAEPPPAELPRLYSGARPADVDLRLKNVQLTSDVTGGVTTRIHAEKGRVSTDYLEVDLNRSIFRGEFRGENRPDGVHYRLALKGTDALSLREVLAPFLPGPSTDLGGYLKNLDLALEWLDGSRRGDSLETLTGRLEMAFGALVIPNTVTRGTFGGLLLAPLEMLARMDGMLPREIVELRQMLLNDHSFQQQLKTVHFSNGEVRLSAENGDVTVELCRFFGDWVRRLEFTGSFHLDGDQRLELESKVAAAGTSLVVPIGGTLKEPEVTFSETAVGNIVSFLEKLREFHLIGTAPGGDSSDTAEPMIVIDELPAAGTIREIRKMFEDVWNTQDDGN